MHLRLIVLFVFIFCVHIIFAQHTLTGRIISKEDQSIVAYAYVQLQPSNAKAVSNSDGVFTFKNIDSGSYMIEIGHIGFESFSKKIIFAKDTTINIQLAPNNYLSDEVIVYATRALNKTPTTYTELDKKEIEEQNFGQDLPYMLQQTPSVVATSDAGTGVGYTGIRIRGTDPTRINVTINGIPINDSESHGVWWVNMPDLASSVNSIQVQRGVGTSTNGAATFGASINIQTSELHKEPYAKIDNSIGSFSTRKHTIQVGSGLMNDKFSVDARLSKIYSNGYIDRAYADLKSYFVSAAYYSKSSLLRFNHFLGHETTYQAWYGVPEDSLNTNRTFNPYSYDNEVDNYQQAHYQLIWAYDINQQLTCNTALHYTKGAGYYEQYREDESLGSYGLEPVMFEDNTISSTDLIRRRWLDNDFYGLTYSLIFNPFQKTEFTFGGSFNNYIGKHYGEIIWAQYASNADIRHRYYDNNAQKMGLNTFIKTYYSFNSSLSMFIDLQLRNIHYEYQEIDKNGNNLEQSETLTFFNPKGGFTYQINQKYIFYTSYAIAQREPVRDDYVDSPIGKKPKPEILKNLEVGLHSSFKNLELKTNFYWMDYKNQLALTGEINESGAYTRTNIEKSYRYGIEVQINYKIMPKLSFNLNTTLSQNKVKNFKEYIDNYDEDKILIGYEYIENNNQFYKAYKLTDLAFSPSTITNGSLTYTPIKNYEISFLSRYVGKQYLDNTSNESRILNAYWINDLRMSYIFNTKFIETVTCSLLINNIFNKQYESNGYTFSYKFNNEVITENYFYPQAGTNFLIRLMLDI